MAKTSVVQRNLKRQRLAKANYAKRQELKAKIINETLAFEERMAARDTLNQMRKNTAAVRVRNRCQLTGRPRGNYQKFGLCRIKVRELASAGLLPGVVMASW